MYELVKIYHRWRNIWLYRNYESAIINLLTRRVVQYDFS